MNQTPTTLNTPNTPSTPNTPNNPNALLGFAQFGWGFFNLLNSSPTPQMASQSQIPFNPNYQHPSTMYSPNANYQTNIYGPNPHYQQPQFQQPQFQNQVPQLQQPQFQHQASQFQQHQFQTEAPQEDVVPETQDSKRNLLERGRAKGKPRMLKPKRYLGRKRSILR